MGVPHPLVVLRFIGQNGKRIGITIAGFTVLIAGLVMMVTPGPGILGIILGLAILGTEYAWARRALEKAKDRARRATNKIRRKRKGTGT